VIWQWARALWLLPILAACDVFLFRRGHWPEALIASAGVVAIIASVIAVATYQRLGRRS
jgi:hypothetical protein